MKTDPQGRFFIGKQRAKANMFFVTQWNPAKREFRKTKLFHRVMIFIVVSLLKNQSWLS